MLRKEKRSRSVDNFRGDEDKAFGQGSSSSDSRTINKVVASIQPPILKYCDNLLTLLLFLEKYDDYRHLGGDISLYYCAYDVIKNRLSRSIDWSNASKEEIEMALLTILSPSSNYAILDLLNQVQLKNQGSNNLNIVLYCMILKFILAFYL